MDSKLKEQAALLKKGFKDKADRMTQEIEEFKRQNTEAESNRAREFAEMLQNSNRRHEESIAMMMDQHREQMHAIVTFRGSKPNNLDFLTDSMRDLKAILRNGLETDKGLLKVTLRCEEHHQPLDVSSFCMLQMDMVQQFPADYMHQCCLGVMLKLLLLWLRGKLKNPFIVRSDLLVHFVEDGRKLYGDELLVYNVHSLVHLASDANVYGGLDECSAFPFENYLHQLKK
ncbi:hypothetical protein E1301_Tti020310 [Triplophysa tibetana]|uniref:Uncharacterized protein n=1 Tax=Triplophysa tibetana TaxID=1572043 RepID=A0A5A9NXV2_9TELE|nr:hypothetical protein E1301_Tti020310 [Triplophysa tibetana]